MSLATDYRGLPISNGKCLCAVLLAITPVWTFFLFGTVAFFGTVSGLLLTLVLTVSTYTDARWRRIPNWVTYTAFGWALVLNSLASVTTTEMGILGTVGLTDAVIGAVVCFGLMMLLYACNMGGAGDVKLAAVIGALLGLPLALNVLLWTYVSAAVVIACYLALCLLLRCMARNKYTRRWLLLFPHTLVAVCTDLKLILKQPVPMAVFFTIGTLIVLAGEQMT